MQLFNVADSGSAGRRAGVTFDASHFIEAAPKIVYQTFRDGASQNGSTPLLLRIKLSREAASALSAATRSREPLSSLVYGALRRFDLSELELYDSSAGCMLGLRMSQAIFSFKLRDRDVLEIEVHRKELPVSTNFGDAPFVFVFLVKPVGELVVSSVFHVASKEAEPRAPRSEPKRKRAPSVRLPTFAHAVGDEATISAMLKPAPPVVPAPAAPSPSAASVADVYTVLPALTEAEEEDDSPPEKPMKMNKPCSVSSPVDGFTPEGVAFLSEDSFMDELFTPSAVGDAASDFALFESEEDLAAALSASLEDLV